MNPFTEEDLTRIKAACMLSFEEYGNQDAKDILNLIARLEEAENSLWHHTDHFECDCKFCNRWRKAAGK